MTRISVTSTATTSISGTSNANAAMPLAQIRTEARPQSLSHVSHGVVAIASATQRAQSTAKAHASASHTAMAASGGTSASASTRGSRRSRTAAVKAAITGCMGAYSKRGDAKRVQCGHVVTPREPLGMPSARTALPAWQKLTEHLRAQSGIHLRERFDRDPGRFVKFSLALEGMLLDYSKQRVTEETMRLLVALARECELEAWRARMLAGERINQTENRAALHVALRAATPVRLDGRDVTREVAAVLADMRRFARGVRSGRIRGATGRAFTDVVNLGIGGSDLGPRLACDALKHCSRSGLRVHFVSNVDGSAIADALARLTPATTLVVISSKTFGTQETLLNAATVRAWLKRGLKGKAARHLCAVTADPERAAAFGVSADRIFRTWDWVGGRYSLCSAVGLRVALAFGMERFDELRAGARAMDEHFAHAPLEKNLPVVMGLLEAWNVNFLGCGARAVLPYDERLRWLPAYLQQLEMESSGK